MRPDPIACLDHAGFTRWPDLLPPALLETTRREAEALYARVEGWQARRGASALPGPLPPDVIETTPPARYVPTADSIALHALGDTAESIWRAAEYALGLIFAAELGAAPPLRLMDHAWLRRQHPPGARRSPQSPHAWHQDGGLGFDYLGGDPKAPGALLRLLTAWVPLVACGRDRPGLQLDARRRTRLIPLDRLAAEAQKAAARIQIPELRAGEAVVMHGGTLHATGPCAEDGAARISVELRWLPAGQTGRLAGGWIERAGG